MYPILASPHLKIFDLAPEPAAEWQRLLRFAALRGDDKRAMARSVEALMGRATEMVAGTYDYLASVPETAAILGWETGIQAEHLEERRRFFTIWLARVLGLDTSDEFAYYLFRAGQYHAGHGPRRIHVPPAYVTLSIGLIGANFARFMQEAGLSGNLMAAAMAGWQKYLAAQLHIMLAGYETARDFERGNLDIPITLFGRLRPLIGRREVVACVQEGQTIEALLRKFFNYYPQAREEALRVVWNTHEKEESAWTEVVPIHTLRPGGWRILLNGRDLAFGGGFATPLQENDAVDIFPPGR